MTNSGNDGVLRAMTDDGAFRVMVARTTETARAVVEAQQVDGFAAHQLGEAVTAAGLVRETMAPGQRVQVILGDGAGSLVVGDAWPEGRTRGLAQVKDRARGNDHAVGANWRVARALPRGGSHSGVVEAPRNGGLDGALATYFARSEQVETFLAVACVTDLSGSDSVRAAFGYVIQLLPELTEPPLQSMRTRLAEFGDLSTWLRSRGDDPQQILDALLVGCAYTPLATSPVMFGCHCSRERAIGAAAALGADDLRQLIAKAETLRIHCDYCRELYEVGPSDFVQILHGA